jgi:4-amino-4-deoxy-L-arabinose transferase-like glycosyltransferase
MDFKIALFCIAALVYGIAFHFFCKTKYAKVLILIVLGGLLLRVFVLLDPFLHEWDERYHLLVAKNLMHNWFKPTLYAEPLLAYDYTQWTWNHVWLHKPPFALWCIALSFKVFGVSEWAARIPSLLFSMGCVFLTYRIALLLFKDEKLAVLAAFFHSINGLIIEMCGGRAASEHIDTAFFFLTELAIYGSLLYRQKSQHAWIVGLGILTGLAVLTKWYVGLFIVGMFFVANARTGHWLRAVLASSVILMLAFSIFYPWNHYIQTTFPQEAAWEKAYNIRHIFEDIEHHGQPWYFHFDQARIIWNELIYVVFIWFLLQWYRQPRLMPYYLLGVWIFVPYTIFSITVTKMTGYVLFTAPAFFILIAVFWVKNEDFFKAHRFLKYVPLLIVLLAVRYGIERVKPFKNQAELVEKRAKIEALVAQTTPRTVIFNVKNYVELMFYSDRIAYERLPTPDDLANIKAKGYSAAVLDDGQLADWLRRDSTILVILK